MVPELSDRDRERFDQLRARIEDVTTAEAPTGPSPSGDPLDPMLASTFEGELDSVDAQTWIAERKFDGTRILLHHFDGTVRAHTRRHIDRADILADLTTYAKHRLPEGLILDGEYCFFTPEGTSRFLPIHQTGSTVERENLHARYLVFDVLAVDGSWCLREPLLERKQRVHDLVPEADILGPVGHEEEALGAFYDRIIDMGEEGIVLKRRDSPYHPGVRSAHWKKVKAFTEANVLAVGYTSGEGRRSDHFGALVLSDGERYLGRVGSGFDRESLEHLSKVMTPTDAAPVPRSDVGKSFTPIEPMVVRVKFQEINRHGKLRAPVYLGRNVEKLVSDVQPLPSG